MGSCLNKNHQPINSIKPILFTPKEGSNPNERDTRSPNLKTEENPAIINLTPENSNPNNVYATEISNFEEKKSRKSHKKLTVLLTNEDIMSIPKDSSEDHFPLVRQISLGKAEQGSILIMNNPVKFSGQISKNLQNEFEEKQLAIEGDDVRKEYMLQHGIWVSCKKGLKPESPNQDDFLILIENTSILLGVFDGHGTHGHEISNFILDSFPSNLLKSEKWQTNPLEAISETFPIVQKDLVNYCSKNSELFDCTLSGSTASLIHIREGHLYIGYVGDSRAVLGKRLNGQIIAHDLTKDHKPKDAAEYTRIIRMGGEVKKIDHDIPYRVFVRGKNYPGIAMSRTIGDSLAQNIGVVCIPDVKQLKIEKNDEFVVVCSDGVWEFITSQEAVEEIFKFGTNVRQAAENLACLAWKRWIENEVDVVDDITVVIALLNKSINNKT